MRRVNEEVVLTVQVPVAGGCITMILAIVTFARIPVMLGAYLAVK